MHPPPGGIGAAAPAGSEARARTRSSANEVILSAFVALPAAGRTETAARLP